MTKDECRTLGDFIFEDIDENEYLNELYHDAYINYGIKILNVAFKKPSIVKEIKLRNINLIDALRFADILSKSTHSEKSDYHKLWAQKLITLLAYVYPEEDVIKPYAGSVLFNIGNLPCAKYIDKYFYYRIEDNPYYIALMKSIYRKYDSIIAELGMSLINQKDVYEQDPRRIIKYRGFTIFEQLAMQTKKALLTIPAEQDMYFLPFQKQIYDHLSDSCFIYSGPIGAEKTFVFLMFIKEHLQKKQGMNFAIIEPNNSTASVVKAEILERLKDEIEDSGYRVITLDDANEAEFEDNFILVLTPDTLSRRPDLLENVSVEYLFMNNTTGIFQEDCFDKIMKWHDANPVRKHLLITWDSNVVAASEPLLPVKLLYKTAAKGIFTINYSPNTHYEFSIKVNHDKLLFFSNRDGRSMYLDHRIIDKSFFYYIMRNVHEHTVFCYDERNCGMLLRAVIKYIDSDYPIDLMLRDFLSLDPDTTDENQYRRLLKDKELFQLAYFIFNFTTSNPILPYAIINGIAWVEESLPPSAYHWIKQLYRTGKIKVIISTPEILSDMDIMAENLYIYNLKKDDIRLQTVINRSCVINDQMHNNIFYVEDLASTYIVSDHFDYGKLDMTNLQERLSELDNESKKELKCLFNSKSNTRILELLMKLSDIFDLDEHFSIIDGRRNKDRNLIFYKWYTYLIENWMDVSDNSDLIISSNDYLKQHTDLVEVMENCRYVSCSHYYDDVDTFFHKEYHVFETLYALENVINKRFRACLEALSLIVTKEHDTDKYNSLWTQLKYGSYDPAFTQLQEYGYSRYSALHLFVAEYHNNYKYVIDNIWRDGSPDLIEIGKDCLDKEKLLSINDPLLSFETLQVVHNHPELFEV